jgi:hypothetical protein
MRWFISQAIYDPEPMIKLLKEYGALCREKKIEPKRVVLTFAPCGREKTMRFIKWLGVTVPEEVEKEARSIHWSPYDRVGVVNVDP